MATLTVGNGEQYSTIEAAVAASSSGDTVAVDAGTYTNDFVTINHDLTLQAVGGTASIVATQQPPDGKAIIDEGGSGTTVSISGFDLSGATVSSGNGAGIRYEGGALTLADSNIHDNQEGLLGAADPAGAITINQSTFANNGAGDGYTHNIYIGGIQAATIENSTITSANAGHDIKSRAANTTITGNTITDGPSGTASYEIDLPNGGNGVITGNTIEKGANASNPIAITTGEEGNLYASSSLLVDSNTLLNDLTAHAATTVVNDTPATAQITNNSLYGWATVSSGPANDSGNTILATEPNGGGSPPPVNPTPVNPTSGPDTLDLSVSEDAWQGDAQFTIAVNGQTLSGVYTATASHAAGATQDVSVSGNWGPGPITAGVSFINDAYGGSSSTDRNLYVDRASYDGQALAGAPATLDSNGTANLATPVVAQPGTPTAIALSLAEDAWQGDAQYSVAVDGTTLVQDGTATASNAQGQSQTVKLQALLSAGTHDVAVSFLNDAYGGSSSTDRNLYVKGIGVDGNLVPNSSASLYSNGAQHFQIVVPSH